jgi:hypothetical protein
VVFGKMRVCSLDLYKAFTANRLITASCMVKVRRIHQETNGALFYSFVKINLERLAVDKGIVGKLNLLGAQVSGGCIAGAHTQGGS